MLFEDNSGDSIPLTRLSSNQSVSNPDIAYPNENAFLVWEGAAAGNSDIFFKKISTNFFEKMTNFVYLLTLLYYEIILF